MPSAEVLSPPATATPSRRVVEMDLEYMCEALQDEMAELAGKQLLITGGAGFLGYYLVQVVLYWARRSGAEPIRVTVLDSFLRGMPGWLEKLSANSPLQLLTHDITEPLPASLPDADYIIHAASIASPTYYRRYPIETMDANVHGLRALLDHARARQMRQSPIGGLLFLSSSEIYGDPPAEHIPTPETYRGNVSCTGPRACYDEAKRYGETLCVNFAGHVGIPVTVARPFNNYGPGLKITDRRVLPDFAADVLAGRDIVLYSDGNPRRTFCYVADAVIGYYKVLVGGRPGEAYNIGVEEPEVSIRELAELVAGEARDLFGYRGRVIQGRSSETSYLVDNPARRCPSIDKARTELGYRPTISLREGVRRSLLWYRDHTQAPEG